MYDGGVLGIAFGLLGLGSGGVVREWKRVTARSSNFFVLLGARVGMWGAVKIGA